MMKHFLSAILFLYVLCGQAHQVTYYIKEYNSKIGAFVLTASGVRPVGSYAEFESKFGATTGNRYNQVPRNQQATLWLMGWEGCSIEGITLSMCSNNTSGTAGVTLTIGDRECYSQRPEAFNSEYWFGEWVSKDHGMYVDIAKPLPSPARVGEAEDVAITIKGGTPEGSVYVNAITIDYTTAGATEIPLGWSYEKVEAKGKLTAGDVLMLYRSGDAAGDIDGMQNQHYLDAIALNGTANVDDPFVSIFTLEEAAGGHWRLANQYGEHLGATAAQSLIWDGGIDTWDITLGYDGATIASTNTKYGTLRYNAPAGSYPRFWNYTSKTLPLPYIYRRTRQQQPVLSTSLTLPATERRYSLSTSQEDSPALDTLVLRPILLPTTATDRRIFWQSTNEQVAIVRSGIVNIVGCGDATIIARSADGASEAQCHIIVDDALSGIVSPTISRTPFMQWDLQGHPLLSAPQGQLYIDSQRRINIRQ